LKDGNFEGLSAAVADRCRACYVIGEAAERIAEALSSAGVELVQSGDLEHALLEASRRARAGDTVLLSPACASFDQYRDYEERGDHFRELVAKMARAAEGPIE
jgi:UDP-N-acetylmuramoylalanine--D-glutamate ligase